VADVQVKARITYSVDNTRYTQPIRLVASSTSGEWLKSSAYLEYPDPVTGVTRQYRALEEAQAGVMQISPYPTSNTVQMKRSSARRVGSTVSICCARMMRTFTHEATQTHKGQVRCMQSIEAPAAARKPLY
jgi:hypothetical protein